MPDPRAEIEARIHRLEMLRSHALELVQAERGLRASAPSAHGNRLLQLLDEHHVGELARQSMDEWTRELVEAMRELATLPEGAQP